MTGYEADLDPAQAWELLSTDPNAVLVDVRTKAEWASIGVPDSSDTGKKTVFVEWNTATGRNPDFVAQLTESGVTGGPILFICRSGQRSIAAAQAAAAAGLGPAYNVTEGFEGAVGADGRRGATGWKASGLPWRHA